MAQVAVWDGNLHTHLFTFFLHSPLTGNFTYTKYNGLVMQLGISKRFKKKKGECIHYEKAD